MVNSSSKSPKKSQNNVDLLNSDRIVKKCHDFDLNIRTQTIDLNMPSMDWIYIGSTMMLWCPCVYGMTFDEVVEYLGIDIDAYVDDASEDVLDTPTPRTREKSLEVDKLAALDQSCLE